MAKGFESAVALIRLHRDQLKTPTSEDEFKSYCDATIAVIRVYWSSEEADQEAARLNNLNASKECFYYCQHTRVKLRNG